jgi:signal peptide peptidase SppA
MAKKTTSNSNLSGMISVLQRMSLKDMLIVGETTDRVMADLTRYGETDAATEGVAAEVASREALELAYGYDHEEGSERKPFVYVDGVAVIPIHGTLINRFNGSWGFVTGYNYVRRMLNLALDDDDVEQIVFDVDSPGGEASGCFELAREIMMSRKLKPSLAMVDSLAASGGIALACCATTMYAIPSARIGSIGVYRMHISYEGALKQEGIKVTFATAGEHKIDGNPYKDLPQSVLDEWTESAGKTWDDFIALVAEAREMSEADVRATQARIYRADEALDKGLIDAVKTTTEAIDAWLAELADGDPSTDEEEEAMTDKKAGSEVASGLTRDEVQGMISTAVNGVATMMARNAAIKDHAAAKGQVALGAKLIANVAITEEDAIGMIDAAAGNAAKPAKGKGKGKQSVSADNDGPGDEDDDDEDGDDSDEDDGDSDDDDGEEAADAARKRRVKGKSKVKGNRSRDNVNHLDRAMGGTRQPNVGAGDEGEDDDDDSPEAQAAMILGDHSRVAGASWSDMKKAKKSKAA